MPLLGILTKDSFLSSLTYKARKCVCWGSASKTQILPSSCLAPSPPGKNPVPSRYWRICFFFFPLGPLTVGKIFLSARVKKSSSSRLFALRIPVPWTSGLEKQASQQTIQTVCCKVLQLWRMSHLLLPPLEINDNGLAASHILIALSFYLPRVPFIPWWN